MPKQTSIEWLFTQLPTIDKNDPYYKDIFNTAKQLHEKEIKNAWINGWETIVLKRCDWSENAYYENKYGKNKTEF